MSVEVDSGNARVPRAARRAWHEKRITFSAGPSAAQNRPRDGDSTPFFAISAARKFSVKNRRLESVDCTEADLPDYSADWRLPKAASKAEIEARFYYEFARESEAILRLTKSVSHFTRREILAGQLRGPSYPGEGLSILHPRCEGVVFALLPGINLREVSWSHLEPDQRESLINAFSPMPAFRPLPDHMLTEFGREIISPTKPDSDVSARWCGSSRLFYNGIEQAGILIDWSWGPQAVEESIRKWFVQHKRDLARLKSEGKLYKGGFYFRLPDQTGAASPRKKQVAALRGLGAMRLLGTHSLTKAIEISRGSGRKGGSLFYGEFDAKRPAGYGAWKKGIDNARKTFQELFYPQDDYSLHLRRSHGLPDLEEPISYRRYCKKKGDR